MVSSSVISTIVSSLTAVTTAPARFFNVVNPLYALPSGKNDTGALGASIVGVDSTATTYQIGCNGFYNGTAKCRWGSDPHFVYTQGPTKENFVWSNSGDFGEALTIQGNYTYASTLAPTITGTFQVTSFGTEFYDSTTFSDLASLTMSVFSESSVDETATWYAIPITAGLEKLSQGVTATATANVTGAPQVFNVINPIWELPGGKNATGPFGASIVGIDSTATTYKIGCNGGINQTKICDWTTNFLYVTQGPTSEHFSWSEIEESGDALTIQGDYIFSSPLAAEITGTFQLTEMVNGRYHISRTTILSTIGSPRPSATWYAIPITAGLEKLSQGVTTTATVTGGPQITASGTSGSGKGTVTRGSGVASTSASTAGGKRVVGRGEIFAGVAGGLGVLGVLVL